MRRLFITTNFDQAVRMYDRDGYENEKIYTEKNFIVLPIEYILDGNSKIIIHKDSFLDWESFNIDILNDYILYHASSEQNVKSKINELFTYKKPGSHLLNKDHDKVFQAIIAEKKFDEILNLLFPTISCTDVGSTVIRNIGDLEAQNAFLTLYKTGTIAIIKKLNKEDIKEEIKTLQEKLQILKYVFVKNEDKTEKLFAIDCNNPQELMKFLQSHPQLLEDINSEFNKNS